MKAKNKKDGYTVYNGVIIWINTIPGYALKYSASGYGSSDTLSGMKHLIKDKNA
jgi:hypothetical protein